jgi:hypothetical protein
MSLLNYFLRKGHQLETDKEAGTSDEGLKVVAETSRNEASEGNEQEGMRSCFSRCTIKPT